MEPMLAAAPSWSATIGVCAVLFPVATWAFVPLLRELGEPGGTAADRPRTPLPLILFVGVPVAVLSGVLFVNVAHRDHRLEGNEAAVLGAGTGAILLLIAIDLVRSARRHHPAS